MWNSLSLFRAIRVYNIAEGLTEELPVLFDWAKLPTHQHKRAFNFTVFKSGKLNCKKSKLQ